MGDIEAALHRHINGATYGKMAAIDGKDEPDVTGLGLDPARGDAIRVLVVEDDATRREIMVTVLSDLDYEVISLANGEGLDWVLDANPMDIALLDILLGEDREDGYALAARLRQRSRCGIIMTTALGERESRIRGLDEGADAYLVKPIDFDELEAVIRSVLRRLRPTMA